MPVVYANIGSNLGDREQLIVKTLERIGESFGYYCISRFVESEPWGFESANRFLNVGVAFKTEMHPEDLLAKLKDIEKEISSIPHRDSSGNYKDREIDIDIMAFEEGTFSSSALIIPHKFLGERDFFLLPLKDLSPEWIHPLTGFSVDYMLRNQKK